MLFMDHNTTGALGGEARCSTKMPKKWFKTVARLAPERLQPGLGNSRCARVRRGASRSRRERFGELSELRNRLSGSFRSSKIGSQSPLSDHFGGMFDFKAGRWHCGAHAMAENTESHETCSTLSTNALDVRFFFPGSAHVASGQEIRRPWRGVWGGTSEWVLRRGSWTV